MADSVKIFRGIKHVMTATGLPAKMQKVDSDGYPVYSEGVAVTEDAQYYAMLRNETEEVFIRTQLTNVIKDSDTSDTGSCVFVWSFNQTDNLPEGKVNVQIFDKHRNSMAFYKNYGKVVSTSLTDTDPDPEQEEDESDETESSQSTSSDE